MALLDLFRPGRKAPPEGGAADPARADRAKEVEQDVMNLVFGADPPAAPARQPDWVVDESPSEHERDRPYLRVTPSELQAYAREPSPDALPSGRVVRRGLLGPLVDLLLAPWTLLSGNLRLIVGSVLALVVLLGLCMPYLLRATSAFFGAW